MKSPRHDLGLGWTVVDGVAGDPTVGIRAGNVIDINHEGITVSNGGLIETYSQREAEGMKFIKED
jgi:hypothetical protein